MSRAENNNSRHLPPPPIFNEEWQIKLTENAQRPSQAWKDQNLSREIPFKLKNKEEQAIITPLVVQP